jgi:hypothetical protein
MRLPKRRTLNTNGTNEPCAKRRTAKQDIHQLDRDAALDAFEKLQPVTFAYKAKPDETRIGFIAEDVPSLVATADRKGLSSMDIVAVLTKVVQEPLRTIEDLKTRLQLSNRNRSSRGSCASCVPNY